MKRIAIIVLVVCILLCGCQRNDQATEPATNEPQTPSSSENIVPEQTENADPAEIASAQEALQTFFQGYAVADYESMKQYATESAISAYFHDGDVYGNVTAELTRSDFEKTESESQVVFYVRAAIDPTESSALYGSTEAGFYVRLLQEQGEWRVHEFFTGF